MGAVTGIMDYNQKMKGKQRTPNGAAEAAVRGAGGPAGDMLVDGAKKLDPTGGKANDLANKALKPLQDAVGQTQVDDAIAGATSGLI